MTTATPATGRSLPSPGKTVAQNRPASRASRPAASIRSVPRHVTLLHLRSNRHFAPNIAHRPRVFNRQPVRLEITVYRRKQTPATPLNRQLFHAFARASQLSRTALSAGHSISNRHTVRLEIAISHRKQTTAPRSNRHKNTILDSRKPPALRAGTSWGLCGSLRSANAGPRSCRSDCHTAPGR
jgi:hypothetical protein